MRFLVALPVVVMLIACSRKSDRAVADTSTSVGAVRDSETPSLVTSASTTNPTQQGLSCSPTVLRRGDTLVLRMKTPHPEYLMADDPDGTNFFIVNPSLGDPSLKYSYVPSDEFRNMSVLRIPSDIKANPRVVGRDKGVEPLFSRAGKYVITLGELEGRADVCKIQFRP
jgi:hypothetical protein